MSRITGGCRAPRAGIFPREFTVDATIDHRHRAGPPVKLEAGDVFPGDAETVYECGELRPGEVVPKDGHYHNNLGDNDAPAFKAGDTFPAGEGFDPASSWDWVRALDQ